MGGSVRTDEFQVFDSMRLLPFCGFEGEQASQSVTLLPCRPEGANGKRRESIGCAIDRFVRSSWRRVCSRGLYGSISMTSGISAATAARYSD